tara:strand:+ start:14 stop:649 length:636 start_codon:yes stop_codon:yes gene_type:complete
MADKKITALTSLGAAPATGDMIPIVDVSDTADSSAGTTKHVLVSDLTGISDRSLLVANANVADNDWLRVDGTSIEGRTDAEIKADLSLEIGTDVQAYDADTLKADTADTLTKGFNATEYDKGTITSGTYTPDPADGNFQKAVNNGAHTLAPPATTCSIVIQYTNDSSAGTITTSGFTKVDGDTISTANGDDFLFFITRVNGFSLLTVKALQ